MYSNLHNYNYFKPDFNKEYFSSNINRTITYSEFIKNYENKYNNTKLLFRMSKFKYKELPNEIKYVLANSNEFNPEYTQIYLDDDDCLDFLNKYFPDYVTLFNSLVPGAYKSDLVRLCLLYEFGGVYNDIGHIYLNSISSFFKETCSILLVNERYPCCGIHNAFIIVTIKNHPFIKSMLDHIVHNISIKYYGFSHL